MRGGFITYSYGSIEGRLTSIIEKDGKLKIRVEDPPMKTSVECEIPPAILKKALDCFRQRIRVYGKKQYDRDGKAMSVVAEEVRKFADPQSLPEFDEMPPIDLVGDSSVVDYLQRIRDVR